jgi:hypothetical protein
MQPAILAVALALAPQSVLAPAATDGAVAVELAAESTRLRVRNLTDRPQMLVLGLRAHGAHACELLAPGVELEWRYAPGALDELLVDVLLRGPRGLESTGALALAELAAAAPATLSIAFAGDEALAWIASEHATSLCAPSGDLLPEPLLAAHPTLSAHAAAWAAPAAPAAPKHVPVITPSDKPAGDAAPRLERKPLPPV